MIIPLFLSIVLIANIWSIVNYFLHFSPNLAMAWLPTLNLLAVMLLGFMFYYKVRRRR